MTAKQRVAAVLGASLTLVGLGFVALHRTHPSTNKDLAKARIQEAVTSAPKVRTRKFQAAVVKTKDHEPLGPIASRVQKVVEKVTAKRVAPSLVPGPWLQIVGTQGAQPGGVEVVENARGELGGVTYVSTTRGNYDLLDDDALLARVAPRAVMLTRDATGEEHLVFLNSKDGNRDSQSQ